MSLIVQDLSYRHPDREQLFGPLSFSVQDGEKIALIGTNGSGKSTLLQILCGWMKASSGLITASETPYYIPQHFGQYDRLTVAGALGIRRKLEALEAILRGDLSEIHYTELNEDWTLETRSREALAYWGLADLPLTAPMERLSGGEKTRVFLAGLRIHRPGLVLADEPSNHLDRKAREQLYHWIDSFGGSLLTVSHDRTLLNRLNVLYELGPDGITAYGGNYEFYKQQKENMLHALQQSVDEKERRLRQARTLAREAAERQQRRNARGPKQAREAGIPRIMMNTLRNRAEKSTSKLSDVHDTKIGSIRDELQALKQKMPSLEGIKPYLGASDMPKEKIIFEARSLNHTYGTTPLWPSPLNFRIRSGERIVIRGDNGSGKSTLVKLLLGEMEPTEGSVERKIGHTLYLDQEYSLVDNNLSLYEQMERFNRNHLPEHFLKTVLHRFLFPADSWAKPCGQLSGGEKMRFTFCCLQISDQAPDLFVLDEPTNNLDIPSLEIITATVSAYRGTLLVISHDDYFLQEAGIEREIVLGAQTPKTE